MTTKKVYYVELGWFQSGSFGKDGPLNENIKLWVVWCPRHSRESRLHAQPLPEFVFSSEAKAKQFVADEIAREHELEAKRIKEAEAAAAKQKRFQGLMNGRNGYNEVGIEEGRRVAAIEFPELFANAQ